MPLQEKECWTARNNGTNAHFKMECEKSSAYNNDLWLAGNIPRKAQVSLPQ